MRDIPSLGASVPAMIRAIRELIQGRSNGVTSVTLTADATETTFVGPNVNENAFPFLFPLTASAAAELGAGSVYASISRIDGIPTVTITHANDSGTDRTFALAVLGG